MTAAGASKHDRGRFLDLTAKDLAAARAERGAEPVQEYRSRLISDVVTDKLDVHEAAAALPEVDPLAVEYEDDDIERSEALR